MGYPIKTTNTENVFKYIFPNTFLARNLFKDTSDNLLAKPIVTQSMEEYLVMGQGHQRPRLKKFPILIPYIPSEIIYVGKRIAFYRFFGM